MESLGTVLGGEWNSLDAMYSTEESEFMAQLLDYCSIPKDLYFGSNFRIPSENTNVNTCFLPTSNSGSYIGGDFDQILAMNDDFVMKYSNVEANESTPSPVQISDDADINENIVMQLGREDRMPVLESYNEVAVSNAMQKSKKRCGNSAHVQKNRKSVKARKKQKLESTDCTNVENVAAVHKQSSSSYSSEDDSIASQELNGATSNSSDSKEAAVVNLNGKTRAVRGSATDPQSLYAKKRRERINERLRTLQNLVPNGTKVDISTMLEDAVQYVKFLQLQIKLLSSDDTWMYAPIAYNGTDLLS